MSSCCLPPAAGAGAWHSSFKPCTSGLLALSQGFSLSPTSCPFLTTHPHSLCCSGYALTCSGLTCEFEDNGKSQRGQESQPGPSMHAPGILPPATRLTTAHPSLRPLPARSPPGAGWKCDYVKCQCDGTCPVVDGVSLGYMLEKLQ